MKTVVSLFLLVSAMFPQTLDTSEALRKAGDAAERTWRQFAAVNCVEKVIDRRLDTKGKVTSEKTSSFEYMIVPRETEYGFQIEESRTNIRSKEKTSSAPMLVTAGFGALLLIFHPHYQHSYEYASPVEDTQGGLRALRIEFRHAPGGKSPSCLQAGGRNYPLEWRGTAWLEPQSFSVLRIEAGLDRNMDEVGLKRLNVAVVYSPVKLADSPADQWLPSSAVIDLATSGQHWQNTHLYTGYRRFTVETKTITDLPK